MYVWIATLPIILLYVWIATLPIILLYVWIATIPIILLYVCHRFLRWLCTYPCTSTLALYDNCWTQLFRQMCMIRFTFTRIEHKFYYDFQEFMIVNGMFAKLVVWVVIESSVLSWEVPTLSPVWHKSVIHIHTHKDIHSDTEPVIHSAMECKLYLHALAHTVLCLWCHLYDTSQSYNSVLNGTHSTVWDQAATPYNLVLHGRTSSLQNPLYLGSAQPTVCAWLTSKPSLKMGVQLQWLLAPSHESQASLPFSNFLQDCSTK